MNEFKKSMFGGYKKADVDAALSELTKKLDNAEADNKRLEKEAENARRRVSELTKQLSDTETENERLKADLSQREIVFGDIAKIYRRAYGAGHEIVCDSKETAQSLLSAVDNRFEEMLGDTGETVSEYEALHSDIKNIIAALNKDINSVAQTADTVLEKAKAFAGIYGQIKSTVDAAHKDAEKRLSEYELQASEYLSPDAPDGSVAAEPSENTVTDMSTQTEQEEAVVTVTEEIPLAASEDEKQNTTESAPVTADSAEENAEQSPDAVPASEQNTVEIPAAAIAADTAVGETAQINQINNAEKDTVEKGASEFTQYGRKSKLSPEDRSEILRKALLKNGIG